MWASAFVRGQLGSVRAHKLPCQEEPRLFSAILSNGELAAAANTFFFFKLRPHTASILLILSLFLSEWQMVTVLQMWQLSCPSDV